MERMWNLVKKERLLFIYNPVAGKGKIKAKLSEILEQFAEAGYELIVHPTDSVGDARKTALEYAKEKGYTAAVGDVRDDNTASIALHEKLGFEMDRKYVNKQGRTVRVYIKAL